MGLCPRFIVYSQLWGSSIGTNINNVCQMGCILAEIYKIFYISFG